MDREGFRQLLREREVPEDQIEEQVALAERFEAFAGEPPTPDDARAFAAILIKEGLNTWDNLVVLVRYGHFTKNNPVYVALIELLDGSEALQGLYDKLGQAVGEEKRDEVFAGIDLPPLGTPSSEKSRIRPAGRSCRAASATWRTRGMSRNGPSTPRAAALMPTWSAREMT
jgi:hypothetical protein